MQADGFCKCNCQALWVTQNGRHATVFVADFLKRCSHTVMNMAANFVHNCIACKDNDNAELTNWQAQTAGIV